MMQIEILPILKNGYLAEMQADVASMNSLDSYRSSGTFPLNQQGLMTRTPFLIKQECPLLSCGDATTATKRAETDIDNAIKLFEFLRPVTDLQGMPRRALTPVEASDRRLWAYLTHGLFFEYCQERWPIGDKTSKTLRNHIMSHWFFGLGQLRRNAISRLWWAVHLTRAPWLEDPELAIYECDDEYHYTRLLLVNQDIYQGLIERNYGNNLKVRICALESFARNHDPEQLSRTRLATGVSKGINLVAKHTDLAALPVDDLQSLLDGIFRRLASN